MVKRRKYSTLGLAAAMEKGAEKRPKAMGELFNFVVELGAKKAKLGGSCALGAAYEGAFGAPPVKLRNGVLVADGGNYKMMLALRKKFAVIRENWALQDQIIQKNDSQGWTRQRIAKWLRKVRRA